MIFVLFQKAVLKLEVHDDKEKKKAMKTVSGLPGILILTFSLLY